MTETALALSDIDKRFGDVQALTRASLTIQRGTVHAVLGENGAGKTTLMRVAFGMMAPDAGHITIDGTQVTLRSSADAIHHGLGMVHQHFTLVPAMTVAENIALGGRGRLDRRRVAQQVRALADRTGLPIDPDVRVASLGVGAQQRVEIVKALFGEARTLILDEPTAVLTPQESDELFAWLRRFVDDGGTAVLITHKLVEALAVADEVTVLRRGQCVLAAPSAGLELDRLVRAITGDDEGTGGPVRRQRRIAPGASVAKLSGVTVRDARGSDRLKDAHLACAAGEIIGVAGVEGSGVQELLRVLAGRLSATSGSVELPPTLGFVPEDRVRDALIEEFTLTENFALRAANARSGLMPWSQLASETADMMRQHDVRSPSAASPARTLSGGNQQKFVVGRELNERPALVVADNPFRGLDLRAAAHVFHELAACADAGSAVVVSSSDIDELLEIADRMLVMFAGQLREVPLDRTAVANAMVGAS